MRKRVLYIAVALAIIALLGWRLAASRSAAGRDVRRTLPGGQTAHASPHGSVIVLDPTTLVALEGLGYGFGDVAGAPRAVAANDLAQGSTYATLARTLEEDLAELSARPGVSLQGGGANNFAFPPAWLRDPRSRFDLVGVVLRPDRTFAHRDSCGEVRQIYRLVRLPPVTVPRASTRLPMTLNVIRVLARGGDGCATVARAWKSIPGLGAERPRSLARILAESGPIRRIEVNLQNLHGPAVRTDMDDHAEYLLRSFDIESGNLQQRPLLNMPRTDLSPTEIAALAAWVVAHFQEIDQGTAVLPPEWSAMRAVSLTPRGLERGKNRPFSAIFGAAAREKFRALPYGSAAIARSPAALLRRLDEGTCVGCHQSGAVAGFHLLGEEDAESVRFNALAVGVSPHLAAALTYRETLLARWLGEAGEAGEPPATPLASRGAFDGWGARCGLGDAGFAGATCAPGLDCKRYFGDELGTCLSPVMQPGDPCETVEISPRDHPDGDRVTAKTREECTLSSGQGSCAPNAFGFPGGLCSDACTVPGPVGADFMCADLPAAGYESDCFDTRVPIEECLKTHSIRRLVRACSLDRPCRDDFACARVPGSPPDRGACIPPYFVFQARVDGPRLDR